MSFAASDARTYESCDVCGVVFDVAWTSSSERQNAGGAPYFGQRICLACYRVQDALNSAREYRQPWEWSSNDPLNRLLRLIARRVSSQETYQPLDRQLFINEVGALVASMLNDPSFRNQFEAAIRATVERMVSAEVLAKQVVEVARAALSEWRDGP